MEQSNRQQVLEKFFDEFIADSYERVLIAMVVVFMEVVFVITMCVPYQVIEASDAKMIAVMFYFGGMGIFLYMYSYRQFKEQNKMIRIAEKLKYVPISKKDLRIFKFRKVFKFCFRIFLICLVGQCILAIAVHGGLVWGNIWYPVVFCLLLPLGMGSLTIW